MSIRFALLAGMAFLLAGLSAASPFVDAAKRLDGEWRGDGFVLKIDSRRAQASIDPNRPFEWGRFIVKDVREDDVVFTIGAELFEATVDADALRLTGTSFRGEKVLRRASEGRR